MEALISFGVGHIGARFGLLGMPCTSLWITMFLAPFCLVHCLRMLKMVKSSIRFFIGLSLSFIYFIVERSLIQVLFNLGNL